MVDGNRTPSTYEVTMNVNEMYKSLYNHYGNLNWWPAQTPYEVMVGAVLTQNTNWLNVEKAIANFGDRLSPEFVSEVDIEVLKDIIRPAGFFNQKAVYVKEVTAWFSNYHYQVELVQSVPLSELRKELRTVKGIGNETADSILLYAFHLPTFVVDAYTLRLNERVGIPAGKTYMAVKDYYESQLPGDVEVYNHMHALIVINAKEHCKKKPVCGGCPLFDYCDYAKNQI